ncbi:MAG: hypothetical protein Q9174_002651 [Haloplaca sp. 1 TL-2023]
MRLSIFFAAVLLINVTATFPSGFQANPREYRLIARTGQGGSSKQGSSSHRGNGDRDHREYQGYTREGTERNNDSPANDKATVRKAVEKSHSVKGQKIPLVTEKPRRGETAMYNDRNEDGVERTTYLIGDNNPTHLRACIRREDAYPRERYAERHRAFDGSNKGRREKETTGRLPKPDDLRGDGPRPDAIKEEKYMFGLEQHPVNYKKVGKPGPTTMWANGEESTHTDGKAGTMFRNIGEKDGHRNRVFRVQANPSKKFQAEFEKEKSRAQALRAPDQSHQGYDAPYERLSPDSESMFLQPMSSGSEAFRSDSGSGSENAVASDRSNSPPTGPGRSGYRTRSYNVVPRSSEKQKRRDAKGKRDAVKMGAENEVVDQSNPHEGKDALRQEFQEYLDAFGLLQSNATKILMPIVEDLVEGSDSETVWGMGLEILTMTDPNIVVDGSLFHGGMHACDWYEDQIANETDADTMINIMVMNAVLIDMYQNAWNAAMDALNSTNLLDDIISLEDALESKNDTGTARIEDNHVNADNILDFYDSLSNSTLTELNESNQTSVTSNVTFSLGENTTISS